MTPGQERQPGEKNQSKNLQTAEGFNEETQIRSMDYQPGFRVEAAEKHLGKTGVQTF